MDERVSTDRRQGGGCSGLTGGLADFGPETSNRLSGRNAMVGTVLRQVDIRLVQTSRRDRTVLLAAKEGRVVSLVEVSGGREKENALNRHNFPTGLDVEFGLKLDGDEVRTKLLREVERHGGTAAVFPRLVRGRRKNCGARNSSLEEESEKEEGNVPPPPTPKGLPAKDGSSR